MTKFLSLEIWEESARGPGEVQGKIFRGFWLLFDCFQMFLEVLRWCGVALFSFKEELEVLERSGRGPGGPGELRERSGGGFPKVLVVFNWFWRS